MYIYTVKQGDTLYEIANNYGVSAQELLTLNQIGNANNLLIGQNIMIPIKSINHKVLAGQTLYSIANMYNTTVREILRANPSITNSSNIYIGQTITIPLEKEDKDKREIDVNGYVFLNITDETLQETLPYLTYLSPFSNHIRRNGTIERLNDDELIERANNAGVAPLMVLSNIQREGNFSGELANSILGYNQMQNVLIDNIMATIKEKGYRGVNIDFEYVYLSDRENYNRFLRKLKERLNEDGYILTTAVAPKISGNQPGDTYQGHDYVTHGEVADKVIIMTYEWGYTFSEPMPVAPIRQVERVLQYATSVMPSDKILMGMPNYGYDWALPYVPGQRARAISNIEAIRLATRAGAKIEYNNEAQSPYFYYYDIRGNTHIVWFDDPKSIQKRLELVGQYNLGGVSFWTLNSLFRANFAILSSMYTINNFS